MIPITLKLKYFRFYKHKGILRFLNLSLKIWVFKYIGFWWCLVSQKNNPQKCLPVHRTCHKNSRNVSYQMLSRTFQKGKIFYGGSLKVSSCVFGCRGILMHPKHFCVHKCVIPCVFCSQVHDVQRNKAAKPNWGNENIYETLLHFMYGGTFNDPKKAMWKTRHSY